jgi:hypothetical protein
VYSDFQELIRLARAGDEDAAARLAHEFEPFIRRFVRFQMRHRPNRDRLRPEIDNDTRATPSSWSSGDEWPTNWRFKDAARLRRESTFESIRATPDFAAILADIEFAAQPFASHSRP